MPEDKPIVLTLVHGTAPRWGEREWRESLWTKPDSGFCTFLEQHSTRPISFRRFCWNGTNSSKARSAAAESLAERLRETLSRPPESDHFLIAHSHGGNVALYALMRSPELAGSLKGVVCLSTPFLEVRPRWPVSFLIYNLLSKNVAIFLPLLLLGLLLLVKTVEIAFFGGWGEVLTSLFTSEHPISDDRKMLNALYLGSAMLLLFGLGKLARPLRLRIEAVQQRLTESFRVHLPEGPPIGIVRAPFDEAGMGLTLGVFYERLNALLLAIVPRSAPFFWFLAALGLTGTLLFEDAGPRWLRALVNERILSPLGLVVLSMGLLAVYLLSLFVFFPFRRLAFGSSFSEALLTRTVPRPRLPETEAIQQEILVEPGWRPSPAWRHSSSHRLKRSRMAILSFLGGISEASS